MGTVYLVGAGPGDVDLLTIKALKIIKKADVILYDRLVNPEIVEMTNKDCEKVYVGKQEGKHALPQEEINELLAKYAGKKDTVVRLKGGDPFVFGRGGEEAMHLVSESIPFEVVPGISSYASAPAYAGIPLTHRGVATTFAVVAGYECPKKQMSFEGWESYKNIDTLVILMGVRKRKQIAKKLLEIGRNPKDPVAFIQEGTKSSQKVYESTLEEVAKGEPLGVVSPAVTIIGEVVRLRENLGWFFSKKEVEKVNL